MSINCILFDLDGTLLDTSYDFAYALNQTCQHFNQPSIPYATLRQTVSQGGLAMTQLAFPQFSGEALEEKRQFFLTCYYDNIDQHTRVFAGLETGLAELAATDFSWGIVTNKPGWLTERLLSKIPFASPPKSIISGDTLEVRKPHPQPLWLAAEQCGVESKNCLYIGDHPRDIEAGKNANMKTAAALYGYIPTASSSDDWQADYVFSTPIEISHFIKDLVCLHKKSI